MSLATLPQIFTTTSAAESLGITDGRVRQILRALEEAKTPIGTRAGRAWLLTEEDVEAIRNLPDGRLKDSRKKSS